MLEFSAVRAVWFSPTGSTKTITEYVAKGLAELLGVPMKSSSYTLPADREMALNSVCSAGGTENAAMGHGAADTTDISALPGNEIEHRPLFLPGELVVWGTPTYAGRIPNKTLDFVREVLTTIAGNLMVAIAVYGNRSFDNCLAELGGLMKKGGHLPIAGIAMPTRHTFSKTLGAGRPDAKDFEALDEFCVKIRNKLMDTDIAPAVFPGEESPEKYYVPKRLDGEPAVFLKAKPQLDREKCTGCGTCAAVCPMGSITFADSKASSGDDNAGISVDKEIQRSSEIIADLPIFLGICIKCQACIQHCKNGALYFDDPDFLSHVAMLEANFASPLKNPELFI